MGTAQSHFSLTPLCQKREEGKAPIFTEQNLNLPLAQSVLTAVQELLCYPKQS